MEYLSQRVVESQAVGGVRFYVRRVSLGRRIELARRVHELSRRIEFLEAGKAEREQIEAAWLAGEIDAVYVKWGIERIEGLNIDGQAASVDDAVERGPEGLCREMLAAVRAEAALTGEERKN